MAHARLTQSPNIEIFMPDSKTRFLLPALSSLYDALEPYGYAIMRLAAGAMIATFGWGKLFNDGMARDITLFHQLGLEPAVPLAYFTSGLEFFGGIMIAVGLLTRPIAAMLFVEMLVILFMVMIPRGAGYQLTGVWAGAFLLIALHGGGRVSIDRLLGLEV
jgi:putative oxidoreductase